MPAAGIKPHAELKLGIVVNRGGNVFLVQDLFAVEPHPIQSVAAALPADLKDNRVPSPRSNSRQVVISLEVSAAIRLPILAADGPRGELVALQPHHGRRHPVVPAAASTGAISNELGDVEPLPVKLPVVSEAESESHKTACRHAYNLDYGRPRNGSGRSTPG